MKIKFIATIITVLFSISSISCYAIEKDESENNTFSFHSDVFEYDIITTNTNPPQTNVYVYLPSDIMASEFFEKIEITGGLLLLSPIDTSQFTISFFGKTDVFNEDMDNIGNIIPVVAENENNTFSFHSDVFEYDIITTNTNPPQTNVYVYLPSDIMASEFFEKIEITGGILLLPPIDTSQFPISFFAKIDVFNEDMDNIGNIIPVVAEDVNLDGNVNKMDLVLTLKKALIESSSMDIYMRQYDFNNDGEINCFDLVFLKKELLS